MSERTAYGLDEWARRNGLGGRGMFYKLKKLGKAPRHFKAGNRTLVSVEADDEWRRALEAEAAQGKAA